MSSILDALEKSERERNQNAIPQYHDMQPPEETHFRWKWLLIISAFLALLVAIYMLWPSLSSLKLGAVGEQQVTAETVVLDYEKLNELERSGVPNERINVISVSTDRQRSFVMLGEKMYREGDSVAENTTLDVIEKDHIVFNKAGLLIKRSLE